MHASLDHRGQALEELVLAGARLARRKDGGDLLLLAQGHGVVGAAVVVLAAVVVGLVPCRPLGEGAVLGLILLLSAGSGRWGTYKGSRERERERLRLGPTVFVYNR